MSKHESSRRLAGLALACVAVTLAAGGIAYASIPDASGVIHGCYKTNQGTLRVIDTDQGQTCANSESLLNWNQKGPIGAQGSQGPQGDPGPTYAAGTGIGLSLNTFDILGSYQLPQGCSSGQSPFFLGAPLTHPWSCFTAANAGENCTNSKFINGIDANGDITCATPPSTPPPSGPDVWVDREIASQDTPVDIVTNVATLSLPAGTFLIQATGTAQDDNNSDDQVSMYCQLDGQGGGNRDVVTVSSGVNGLNASGTISVQDVVSFNTPTDEHLNCLDLDGSDHVRGIVMTAIKVGTVH